MCPPVFIINNQYSNPNGSSKNNPAIEEARELLKLVLKKWAENHAQIFSLLEEEWEDEAAQLKELWRLKQEAEQLHVLVKDKIK
ncbi:hypothetical protein [Arthrospiribacter ruber]|uniref:Uncharacterized protein n=1 Tax=Arthrospiribacter ruber TaxID=2487934 RepID=A0A951IYI4_9BACT|nr:hypothetical protein [Arthrospiribacter ruber]MBW3467793.1 hypothetical protein [Arthrospiribacter ruber]